MSEPPHVPASSHLSDATLARLRVVVDAPDVAGTRYELLEPVGRGGMGVVWRAFDRQLERDVALKVLATTDEETARALADWLQREAKVLARLEHPGIVPVHDVGLLPDGRAFHAMKLVRGPRLDELARAGLAPAERFRIFARICEAVAFAHARGVLHRDLKPNNVMVGEFGEVLVLDWGLAKVHAGAAAKKAGGEGDAGARDVGAAGEDGHGIRVGTPGYMAPEQERGAAVDARADVYSLGKLLAFLGSGEPAPPRPLRAIVARATAASPDDRYASVLELAADVARFQAGDAVHALPEGPLAKLARFHRKYRAAIWLIATYVVFRLAFELWQWRRRSQGG